MAHDSLPETRTAEPAAPPIDAAGHASPSARLPAPAWLAALVVAVPLAAVAVPISWPGAAPVVLAIVTVPFLALAALRAAALFSRDGGVATAPVPRAALPSYTVLVPLYREVAVLPSLIEALAAIDYPANRLDVVLVIEADDQPMCAALATASFPAHVRVMAVPPSAGGPRTKPRALNFALARTAGQLVTVFDAEDVPEPDQLLRAAAMILAGGARIGCVQARLAIDNRSQGFLARQFTIEYAAQFDRLLPTIARLGLPMPLGGTSNHFPRRVLIELGGWDAWNVTEDADLGVRLARAGYEVRVLASTTWEEAPARWAGWLPQRTRWLKGWMQTWIAHMRDPAALWRDLGLWRFLGFQLLIGGQVLSALVHPLLYVLLASMCWRDASGPLGAGASGVVPAAAMCVGFVAPMLLGAVAVRARGWRWLARWALLMPVYWLLVSAAAYRAVWQLSRQPFLWEKTEHSARPAGTGSRRTSVT